MTELTPREYGLIIAALEAYAEDFPDADDAALLLDLAERFTTRQVLLGDPE